MTSTASPTLDRRDPSMHPDRGYYREHVDDLPRRLLEAVPSDELRGFHARSGGRHFAVVLRQVLLGAVCLWGTVRFENPWIWLPLAAVQGTVVLSFIILLHEVVHETVFR